MSLSELRQSFWSTKFWFPDNYTWEVFQLKDTGPYKDIYYPQFIDLLVPFPIAFALLLIRIILNVFVFRPIGQYFKLKEGRLLVPENIPLLQKYYKRQKRPEHEEVSELARNLNWTTRSVERWFRKRRNYDKSSTMKKFCETCWRWVFYLSVHLYGIFILYDDPLIYNTDMAWDGWPHHHVPTQYYVYYMVELGFYWSLLLCLWYDVKRSDYLEHIIHHIITISLMHFSWISNFVRIGVLVLGLHDAVDHLLEAAKICKYLKFEKMCDCLFVMFAIVWIVTRLYIFPTAIVYKCWTQIDYWPSYSVYLVFLSALQVIHIVWTVPLLRVLRRALVKRNVEDVRSASELSSISDDNNHAVTNGVHHKPDIMNNDIVHQSNCCNGTKPDELNHSSNNYSNHRKYD